MPFVLRLTAFAAVLPVLAGCGGSSHPAAGTAATTTSSSLTSPRSTTTSSAHVAPAASSASTSTSTSASAPGGAGSSAPGGGGSTAPGGASGGAGMAAGGGAAGSGGAAAGGSINARVPATFTLAAAGTLSPGQVSAPAFLAIAVRINSASGAAHTATIATPHPVQLRIPPHGAGARTIPGLRAGTYPILIDGARRGALIIGGEPGP